MTELKEEDKKDDSEVMVLYAGPALPNQKETVDVVEKDVCMLCVQLKAGKRGRFSAFGTPEQKQAHAEIHAVQCGKDVALTLRRCFPVPDEEAVALLEREEEGPQSSKSVWDAYEERLGQLHGILPSKSLHCQRCTKILEFGGKVSGIEEHLMAHLLDDYPDIQADRKAYGGNLWGMVEECFPKEEVRERVLEKPKPGAVGKMHIKCQKKDCQMSVLPNSRHGHVVSHFQHPMYECRLCPYKGNAGVAHVQRKHPELEQPKDVIVDKRKVHKGEIQKLKAICFPQSPRPPVTKPAVVAADNRSDPTRKPKKRLCLVVDKPEEIDFSFLVPPKKNPKEKSLNQWKKTVESSAEKGESGALD